MVKDPEIAITPGQVLGLLKTGEMKENCIYSVFVSFNESNPFHHAILFTGFKSGSYCYIYSNSYERPYELMEARKLVIDTELIMQLTYLETW